MNLELHFKIMTAMTTIVAIIAMATITMETAIIGSLGKASET